VRRLFAADLCLAASIIDTGLLKQRRLQFERLTGLSNKMLVWVSGILQTQS